MDATTKPTVVFVHGAWADNSGWDGSIRALRGQGFSVIGAANPLRELRSDATYVAMLLQSIAGPIVMVGHSYGGAVISNAATGNDQVQALVYINGWVPDEGESLLQLGQLNEGSLIPESLHPVPYKNADGSDVVDLYLDQEKFPGAFAGDVDRGTAEVMAVAQRPFTEAAFGAPSGAVAWRSVPSWYLLGTEDKAIPPATQRYMAERAQASIVEIPASHASMVSQPEAVTELILSAVNATAGGEAVGARA
jgi:pimeloyl-ACP methyl ester carboxylesterase